MWDLFDLWDCVVCVMLVFGSPVSKNGKVQKKHRLSGWRIVLAAFFREKKKTIHAVFILTCWVLKKARSEKGFQRCGSFSL
ncbi:hypothetical protein Hanom_Chr05g00402751 [Helianthus anomalus]